MITRAARTFGLLTGLFAFNGAMAPVHAHPHVWVTVESEVVFENGAVTGFKHTWTFDELYTAMAIQGLDTNGDGKYDRNELAELAKVNVDGLKEYKYFTSTKLAGSELAHADAKDYWLEHARVPAPQLEKPASGATKETVPAKPKTMDVLKLHFTVPLKDPVLADAKGLSFSVYDPSYFIAFNLAKSDPVRVSASAPQGCKAIVAHGKSDDQQTTALSEALADQFSATAVATAGAVSIICGTTK